ncbi:MAG: MBL fold metallo-hydrolase [Chloroflexota bacterium]|nr:MBL fold metallo-hydrolase [Chloroflexota bacterium]
MKHYTFTLGHIECTVLCDAHTIIGAVRMMKRFPHIPEADMRHAYIDLDLVLDEADTSMNILLLRLGAETVLVDAGEGGRPYGGELRASLAAAGIAPDAITTVIITHSHGDHVLGLLTDDALTFPNARYIMSAEEMAFWRGRLAGDKAEQRPLVEKLEAAGLRLIAMNDVILPGVTAVPLPGHTPGHFGLMIESDGARLLHLADTLHSPAQFVHPDWSPWFDADTRMSEPTRRAALDKAADENVLTLFYHLTFPGLGRVRRTEAGYRWETF